MAGSFIENQLLGKKEKDDPPLHWVVQGLAGWGISRGLFLSVLFVGLLSVLSTQIPHFGTFAFSWIIGTAPIWLPITLCIAGWATWIRYRRSSYISSQQSVLLEIRLPRDITKSPRAMETALSSLHITSKETTYVQRAWKGQVRTWFSFEFVSFGGEVHMYVWTFAAFRGALEAALYAQYPEIEIVEVEDYAAKFMFDPKKHKMYCVNYQLKKGKVLPLKSYIDFELDKDPKEEFKIEPLAQIFEFLSSIKPNEQVWVQTLWRANGKEGGPLIITKSDWGSQVEAEIRKIRKEASINPGKEHAEEDDEKKYGQFPRPTRIQTEQIDILSRHLGKLAFDIGGRGFYIADKTIGPVDGSNLGTVRNFWQPLSNPGFLNTFGPFGPMEDMNYKWQDIGNIREDNIVRRMVDAYRRRSYFNIPWTTPYNTVSAEVLATMFHPPSRAVAAPGLARIPAQKAEPPPNLPVR